MRRHTASVAFLVLLGCGAAASTRPNSEASVSPAGISASPPGPAVAGSSWTSCETTRGTTHVCQSLQLPSDAAATHKANCPAVGGAVVGGCPTASLLGKCAMTLPPGEPVRQIVYYYSYPGGPTATDLAKGCNADGAGVWSGP
jgi:hypothetical protein